ncbi:MAG TPA: hypothetical protein VM532_14670 [Burkholderiales bacterium]|jgi:hypothetical protein|nr:hypothetical protein [Burkholderiales bacterium]
MKTSDLLQQLPKDPVLNDFRISLEANIKRCGDHEISTRSTSEIEIQVRARIDREFQLQF